MFDSQTAGLFLTLKNEDAVFFGGCFMECNADINSKTYSGHVSNYVFFGSIMIKRTVVTMGKPPKDEATLTRPEDSWVLGGCLFPQSYGNFIGNLTHPRIEW